GPAPGRGRPGFRPPRRRGRRSPSRGSASQLAWLTLFGWELPEYEAPGAADHPDVPSEDDEPLEESDDEVVDPSEEGEPRAAEPELEEPPLELEVAVEAVPDERAAMPPARPRKVSALSNPATIRDRPAGCRRFGRGRGAAWVPGAR